MSLFTVHFHNSISMYNISKDIPIELVENKNWEMYLLLSQFFVARYFFHNWFVLELLKDKLKAEEQGGKVNWFIKHLLIWKTKLKFDFPY